jgi:hypothetical protein
VLVTALVCPSSEAHPLRLGPSYAHHTMVAHCADTLHLQGEWRGMTVAVKTMVFSSTQTPINSRTAPGSGAVGAGSGGNSGIDGKVAVPGRGTEYERAVLEAAVSSSLVHRNIVATYRCA